MQQSCCPAMMQNQQQVTGAVLVSQEPNKVILYRGWGAGEDPVQTVEKNKRDERNVSVGREDGPRSVISPELMSAIKLEFVGGCVDKVIVSTGDHDGVMVVMEVLELARVVVLALVVMRVVVFTEKEVS
ncbi:hypothetical protein F0562_009816 [Nyssa sinensis]|uniref:Uncharacterized protein n=1 Tax=Nyssa sinensis TaxID=561372 RepID=A0A5J4ZWZ5_9ASTE|nr:hypothetical protein F0562_009816 [Nyssa sinensis]